MYTLAAGGPSSMNFMSISSERLPVVASATSLQYPQPLRSSYCGQGSRITPSRDDQASDELHRIFLVSKQGFEPHLRLSASPSIPEDHAGSIQRPRASQPMAMAARSREMGEQADYDDSYAVTPPSRAGNPIVCNSPFVRGEAGLAQMMKAQSPRHRKGSQWPVVGAELGILDLSPPSPSYICMRPLKASQRAVTKKRSRSVSCPEGGGPICGTA